MPLVVIGLGNPGEEYSQNRHNIGFLVVDRLAARCGIRLKKTHLLGRHEFGKGAFQGRHIALVKPLTYMNRSGEVIRSALRQAKAGREDLLVVCDSLDLTPGVLKMKLAGSSGGHRGLESIFTIMKSAEIARLSIGIGRPGGRVGRPDGLPGHPGRRGAVVDHVLGDPDGTEAALLERAVEAAAEFILRLLKEPREKVMSEVNRRVKRDADE